MHTLRENVLRNPNGRVVALKALVKDKVLPLEQRAHALATLHEVHIIVNAALESIDVLEAFALQQVRCNLLASNATRAILPYQN